ncbi:MAG TPA: glycosyltransferase family 2 protein [Anaerolineae bacterium]|nr:glycosyltransferase family 2 protein [Anaerolineae bacterium]HQK12914.1 glycosyltransferase family 2 protein [Anaerolineae bacterium]
MPTLSVIIVSWNVRDLLRRALASVYASWDEQPGLEVIVVDNASCDDSVAMMRDDFPQVNVIANTENRGFTGGNNQGLVAASGDFLLLLNPDTEVVGDALPRMVAYLQAQPDVGMVGPQLLNPDGSVQSSRRRFPTLPVLFFESTWLEKCAPRRWLRYYYAQDKPDGDIQDVDWVTGAAMLTRREVVAQVGGLDEGFFMYSEELDWCRRIRAVGRRVVYFPEARIIHYEGKSSEQVVPARHIYFQSSKVRYTRKYHGAVWAEALRLWLLAQYAWQIGVEGIKWVIGHRRELRAARIAAYRQVLRSRLRISKWKSQRIGEWRMANGE